MQNGDSPRQFPESLSLKSLRRRPLVHAVVAAVLTLPVASCSRGPAPIRPPAISAASAGDQAIELYDTNGDGIVAGDELDKAPGLKSALARLDISGDGAVSADEIAARIVKWKETKAGLMAFSYQVTLDGSPLPGAKLSFEPEPYLGGEIKAAQGQTNDNGRGGASIPKEERPDPKSPPGMHLGLYRVKISKLVGGKETIPARYNEATILGQEVTYDVPEIANNRVVYALKSK